MYLVVKDLKVFQSCCELALRFTSLLLKVDLIPSFLHWHQSMIFKSLRHAECESAQNVQKCLTKSKEPEALLSSVEIPRARPSFARPATCATLIVLVQGMDKQVMVSDESNTTSISKIDPTQKSFFEHRMNSNVFSYW